MEQLPLFYEGVQIRAASPAVANRTLGNTKLIQHGIFEDKSDFRVHVSAVYVYVFDTKKMIERCKADQFRTSRAYQRGIVTAEGFLVNVKAVDDLKQYPIPELLKRACKWPPQKGTRLGDVGAIAERIAETMIGNGLIYFPKKLTTESRVAQQYQGVDLVQKESEVIYQVKSDLRADETRNLYIQTHECNPFREH